MALKIKYAKKDEIPENLQSFYVEKDGAFVLDAEAGDAGEGKVREFRDRNIHLTQENERTKAELANLKKQFEGLDAEQIKKAKELIEKSADEEEKELVRKGDIDGLVKRRTAGVVSQVREETKAAQAAREAAEKRAAAYAAELGRVKIERELALALDAQKISVRKQAMPDVLGRANSNWRINETGAATAQTQDGKQMFGENGEPITMHEYAKQLVKTAPHLFEAAQGGGAEGGRREEGAPNAVRVPRGTPLTREQLDAVAKGKAQYSER
jgi:hypothetical protein